MVLHLRKRKHRDVKQLTQRQLRCGAGNYSQMLTAMLLNIIHRARGPHLLKGDKNQLKSHVCERETFKKNG